MATEVLALVPEVFIDLYDILSPMPNSYLHRLIADSVLSRGRVRGFFLTRQLSTIERGVRTLLEPTSGLLNLLHGKSDLRNSPYLLGGASVLQCYQWIRTVAGDRLPIISIVLPRSPQTLRHSIIHPPRMRGGKARKVIASLGSRELRISVYRRDERTALCCSTTSLQLQLVRIVKSNSQEWRTVVSSLDPNVLTIKVLRTIGSERLPKMYRGTVSCDWSIRPCLRGG